MNLKMNNRGSFLASAVVVTSTFLFIALGMATYVFNRYHLTQQGVATSGALSAAQAGLDTVTDKINGDEYYYKYCSCLGIETTVAGGGSSQDKTTYTIQNVAHTTDSPRATYEMTVTVLGKVYQGASSTVVAQKAIKASLSALNSDGTTTGFDSVVQTGYGPLTANAANGRVNGTKIKATGNILATGTTTDDNTILADYIWAYDWVCPTTGGASYPQRCGPSEVAAASAQNCQGAPAQCPEADAALEFHVPSPTTGHLVNRASALGTLSGDAITPPDLPDIRRERIKSSVVATTTGNVTCATGTLGTKPGETTKITGNLTVDGGACTLRGDLWVQGYLQVSGGVNTDFETSDTDVNGEIIAAAPIVMVDGYNATTARSISIRNHATSVLANTYGIGKILVSYYCAYASCPDGTITGSELFASKNTYLADFEPGTSNTQNHAGLVLYSRWGGISQLRDTNCTCALVGQQVDLGGTGPSVTYDSPDDVNLGGRQGKKFKIKSYQELKLLTAASGVALSEGETAGDIAIGGDGLPIVTYYKQSGVQLKVIKCGNETCSSGNTISIIDTGGDYSSIAIGSDGYPRIAYTQDGSGKRLIKFARCVNHSCSSGVTTSPVHDVASTMFSDVEITIGPDGLPILAYYNETAGDARVAKCGNEACSSGNTLTAVATAGDIGQGPSITIGLNGFPVISYKTPTNSGVQILRCGNAACSSGNSPLEIAFIPNVTGWNSSIAIGADLFPIISHWNETNGSLRITKCTTVTCSSNTSTTVDGDGSCAGTATNCTSGEVGSWSSIQIGSSGRPVIAYRDSTAGDLRVMKCGNAACSSGNTITLVESTGSLGSQPSMALSNEGYPVIVHYDTTNAVPRVVKCASFSCQ